LKPQRDFGKLTGKTLHVSQKGIEIIELHLGNAFFTDEDGRMFPPNRAMIDRLKVALQNRSALIGADASFYMHELSEATKMRSLNYNEATYTSAHQAALTKYAVSPFTIYHPDVIKTYPLYFNRNWRKFWSLD
jgi:hypothetical protein